MEDGPLEKAFFSFFFAYNLICQFPRLQRNYVHHQVPVMKNKASRLALFLGLLNDASRQLLGLHLSQIRCFAMEVSGSGRFDAEKGRCRPTLTCVVQPTGFHPESCFDAKWWPFGRFDSD